MYTAMPPAPWTVSVQLRLASGSATVHSLGLTVYKDKIAFFFGADRYGFAFMVQPATTALKP